MKFVRLISAAVLALALAASTSAKAQQGAPISTASSDTKTAGAVTWTNEQLITSSVHEAWLLSGKNEATFFEMVTQLAQLSASKRGLTLPESQAAGRRAGEMIKLAAKADTSQLLYVVVDKAVQKVGIPAKS